MNLPSDTPRLPKWIFLVGDAALLATAWFIYDSSAHPLSGTALVLVVASVVVASVLGAIPFVTDYARKQDEALDDRQRALQALSVTVAAAAEQVSIAATGLNGIAEAAQENYSKTERLAHGIQEKIEELDARLAAAAKKEGEAAGRLEAVAKAVEELDARLQSAKKDDLEGAARLEVAAKKLGKAAAEFESAAEKAAEAVKAAASAPVHVAEVPPVIASKIVEIKPAVASSFHPFEPPAEEKPKAPEPEAPTAAEPPPAPAKEEPAPEAPVVHETPAPAAEAPAAEPTPEPAAPPSPPAAPRKRSPRKPAATPAAPAAPAEEAAVASPPDLVLESPPVEEPPAPEIAEPAVSADGATRLIVTAYIGIGNRLFIRGEGPGLSWDKGIPLSFVSIGKWRWETNDAVNPVTFRLYKNDETECSALGQRTVAPGAQQELSASF